MARQPRRVVRYAFGSSLLLGQHGLGQQALCIVSACMRAAAFPSLQAGRTEGLLCEQSGPAAARSILVGGRQPKRQRHGFSSESFMVTARRTTGKLADACRLTCQAGVLASIYSYKRRTCCGDVSFLMWRWRPLRMWQWPPPAELVMQCECSTASTVMHHVQTVDACERVRRRGQGRSAGNLPAVRRFVLSVFMLLQMSGRVRQLLQSGDLLAGR